MFIQTKQYHDIQPMYIIFVTFTSNRFGGILHLLVRSCRATKRILYIEIVKISIFEFLFQVRNEEKMEFSVQILLALVIYIEYIRDTFLKLMTSKNRSLPKNNSSKDTTTNSITGKTSHFEMAYCRSDRFSKWPIVEVSHLWIDPFSKSLILWSDPCLMG